GAGWGQVHGVSVVAGIGFTVALFISNLAFSAVPHLLDEARLGVLVGSLVSGVVGMALLRLSPQRSAAVAPATWLPAQGCGPHCPSRRIWGASGPKSIASVRSPPHRSGPVGGHHGPCRASHSRTQSRGRARSPEEGPGGAGPARSAQAGPAGGADP